MALSLYLILRNRKSINEQIGIVLAVLTMSLYKESFNLIIPAFIFLRVYSQEENFNLAVGFKKLSTDVTSIILFVIFSVNLGVVYFLVGTNTIGYAGLSDSVYGIFRGVRSILYRNFVFEALFYLSLFGFVFFEKSKSFSLGAFLNGQVAPLLFSILLVAPQLILYAHSGMGERYRLPATLGVAYLLVAGLNSLKKHFRFSKMLVIILLVFVLFPVPDLVRQARSYAIYEGKQNLEFLEELELAINNNSYSRIVLVTQPAEFYEWSWALKTYIEREIGSNLSIEPYLLNMDYESPFLKGLLDGFLNWFPVLANQSQDFSNSLVVAFSANHIEQFSQSLQISDLLQYIHSGESGLSIANIQIK